MSSNNPSNDLTIGSFLTEEEMKHAFEECFRLRVDVGIQIQEKMADVVITRFSNQLGLTKEDLRKIENDCWEAAYPGYKGRSFGFLFTSQLKVLFIEGDEKNWEPVWLLKEGEEQEGDEEKIENIREKFSNMGLK